MNNRRLFFYRLFAHSRIAFVFVLGFLLVYAFFFFKKMDMTVFSYNSMFVSKIPARETSAYGLKINNLLVNTSGKLWWKKDFLESSLIGYSKYLEHEQTTYLQNYLLQKVKNPITKQFLLDRLTAQDVQPLKFIRHYAATAGYPLKANDKIEILKYKLQYLSNRVEKLDSTVIYIKRSR